MIQVIKRSEKRDEWWFYSIAQWENPYFGINFIIVITYQCRSFLTELSYINHHSSLVSLLVITWIFKVTSYKHVNDIKFEIY